MRVSAIIPVFNRAATVGAALRSILDQPSVPLEVVVVDDGSADDLAGALAPFAGAPLRVIRHPANAGAAAARNTGIAAASGEWIALLDSDDVWLPGKLERQLAFLESRGLAAGCTAYTLRRGQSLDQRVPGGGESLGLADLVWGCYVSPGSTLLARRQVWAEIGPLDPAFRRYEDWDWLMRLTSRHRLGLLAEPLAEIRLSGPPDPAQVLAGLDLLERRHAEPLRRDHPELYRRFRAGLAIERAGLAFRRRRPLAASWHVLASLALVPFGNFAFANVVAPRLRLVR